jgi:O-antigen/teichoic acid export membrane protein
MSNESAVMLGEQQRSGFFGDPDRAVSSKGLTLRANFTWTFAGNVVYSGCQWGMLMVLAKLGSPEMVGQFALGLAVTTPIIMFANLQLRSVQATDARREYRFGHYLALRLLTTALAILVIIGIVFGGGYRQETALVILAVGASKAFESISDVVYGLLQHHERMDRIAHSMMIRGLLSLSALGAAVYLTRSVFWGATALAVVWAILLIAYDLPNGGRVLYVWGGESLRPCWDLPELVRLAWLSLPLGFVMMLISLNTNIPRYFIQHYLGERELGIFAAMGYLMVAGTTVINALGQSASPRLAVYYAGLDLEAFWRLVGRRVGLGAALGAAGILVALVLGRETLTALYRPEYAEHTAVFVWLMVAASVGYVASFLGYGMTAARYFRPQLPLFGLCGAASALGCLWLVPRFGLMGAAWAGLASQIVQLIGGVVINAHAARNGGMGG